MRGLDLRSCHTYANSETVDSVVALVQTHVYLQSYKTYTLLRRQPDRMKRLLHSSSLIALAAVVLLSVCTTSSFAQNYKHDAALGAVFLGIPTIVQGQFEVRIGDDQSLVARAAYGLKTDAAPLDYTGFGIGAAYRFFLTDDKPVAGLSVAPAVDLLFYSNPAGRNSTVVLIGAEGGYKLMVGQISIEPVLAFRIGVSGGEGISKLTSTLIYPGLYLGYAW